MRLKKIRPVPQHFLKYRVSEVGDRREPDIVDQVIGQVIADALDGKYHENGKAHQGPDVVHARRRELFQIDRMIEDRYRKEPYRRVGRSGVEHAVEDGADQQSDGSLGRAYHRHQHHRQDQEEPVPAGISEEAQQFFHTRTRKRSSASFTSCVLTDSMPAGPASTSACVRHGAQIAGSDAPKITTTGIPNAAAMWAGPESFPRNNAAPAMSDWISASGAPATVRQRSNALRSSPAPPMNTGVSSSVFSKCTATSRNLSAGQVLSAAAARGWITA